jgi:hypothetical protein
MLDILHSSSMDAPHIDTPEARTSLRAQGAFFFLHTSPRLLLANVLVLAAARVALASWTAVDVLVFVVVSAWWPFQEWLFHRFLLHRKPTKIFGRIVDPGFARAHRAHHQRPWIVQTTLLPVSLVLTLIPLQPVVWGGLLPTWSLALTAATAYALCALVYEWTHYLSHAHYVPKGSYYRRIWKNHRLHHFKNELLWYSFTVPHVDAWLGTDPPPETVEKSETARTLGVDDAQEPPL